MKLSSAVICVTCDEVFSEDIYKYCPSCTDKYPLRLLPMLRPIIEIIEDKPYDQKSAVIAFTVNDIIV